MIGVRPGTLAAIDRREVIAMPLSLRIQIHRGTPVLNVAGDLDLSTARTLRDACLTLVRNGHRDLVLDLESVALIDSFALDILVGAFNRARALGGDLRLICNQGHIHRILAATGLDELFVVYPSRAALPTPARVPLISFASSDLPDQLGQT